MVDSISLYDHYSFILLYLGPPQVSMMLSVNEQTDFPFETSLETHEEVREKPRLQKTESIITEQKKGLRTSQISLKSIDFLFILSDPHSDSDNEDNPRESKPSLQFLRSMSLNVEGSDEPSPQTPSSASRSLASANDVTQLLLTRLGIMRRM